MAIQWNTLRIGGGGFIRAMDIAADGTKVCKTDTYGAYLWDASAAEWRQIVNTNSMPIADMPMGRGDGVWAIAIAPSNTSRFYMVYAGYVFRTDNRGASWVRTALPHLTDAGPAQQYAEYGKTLAVDPVNADVVFCATPSGVRVSVDAGATWAAPIVALGTAFGPGFAIAFDSTSAVIGGKTQGIYICRYGNGTGVYSSVDGGANWALTVGGPTTFSDMVVAQDGSVYVCTRSGANLLWIYSAGVWANHAVGAGGYLPHTVAVDPLDANRIVVAGAGGFISVSLNHGVAWTGYMPTVVQSSAADVPWLQWANDPYMTAGNIMFDPSVAGRLYFAEGAGVWYTTPPNILDTVTWTSSSRGIEQLIANVIISPPGAGRKPLLTTKDRPLWRVESPDVYPSEYKPAYGVALGHEIVHGWDVDYASSDPAFAAGIFNHKPTAGLSEDSGYSTDGGLTWTVFPAKPAHVTDAFERQGGNIACASPTNILWFPADNCPGYYTLDGGTTWNEVVIAGIPNDPAGVTGWSYNKNFKRRIIAADRVNIGTFYAYNYTGLGAVYRSTDGGVNWTNRSGNFSGGVQTSASRYNARMKTDPLRAGHLYFSAGFIDDGIDFFRVPFMRSINGGSTWTTVPGVGTVFDFGFGKAEESGNIPSIYIAAFVGGIFGIYKSDDDANTWVNIGGPFTLDTSSLIVALSGDMNIVGRVYVGLNGNGFAYADAARGFRDDNVSGQSRGREDMTIRRFSVPITVNGAGNATVYTPTIYGRIVSIAYVKGNFANGVTFVVTGEITATPIWSEVGVNASAVRATRAATHTTAGAAALYAAGGTAVGDLIAISGERIKIVVSSGGASTTGALHFTVDG